MSCRHNFWLQRGQILYLQFVRGSCSADEYIYTGDSPHRRKSTLCLFHLWSHVLTDCTKENEKLLLCSTVDSMRMLHFVEHEVTGLLLGLMNGRCRYGVARFFE